MYATKKADEVSWTEEVPQTSLDFIRELDLPKSAGIIDIGGGDSRLVDYLLQEGYKNLTVVGTFAENGPEKCSGLEVHCYSEEDLSSAFNLQFKKRKCILTQHLTPFKTIQNFTFCSFTRKDS